MNWVLTAAHCVVKTVLEGGPLFVTLGDHYQDVYEYGEWNNEVTGIYIYEGRLKNGRGKYTHVYKKY